MTKKGQIINRDVSWLSFNERVLQEAVDKSVPLIERLRFLGIFSNNLDEFFRVRVGMLSKLIELEKDNKEIKKENPAKLLKKIQETVIEQQNKFQITYDSLRKELEAEHIFIVNEKQLNKEQSIFVRSYFSSKVRPVLSPIMIEWTNKFPYLKDKSLYLAIKLSVKNKPQQHTYSLIEVPSTLPRFIVIPQQNNRLYIILLEDVIRFCLADLFSIFSYNQFDAYIIKLTRDSELEIDTDFSKSITEKISKSLKQRKVGLPVRMVYDEELPKDLLKFLLKKMKQNKPKSLIPGGRYHNFKDFIQFPILGDSSLVYKSFSTIPHPLIAPNQSIFQGIKKQDILFHYPYHSFNHIIDLLHEASIDPRVTSIKITLYRAAQNSNVVDALINAVKNGKQVTAVIELQARFDEQANLQLGNMLQDEGAKVIYGVPGLKVHCKLILISRKEEGKIKHYAHLGTGNFNESTAKIYTDFSLLTSHQEITVEVETLFNFFTNNFKIGNYKHLLVSPFFMRKKIEKLIQNEITFSKKGIQSSIIMKVNSFIDTEIIKKIHQAAKSGVKIKLIVRGTCSFIKELDDNNNIEIISIVDRFLEHARVFIFTNGGDEKYYISSADMMARNLDNRSEVACPIYDKKIQKQLKDIINLQLQDNVKARILDANQLNNYKRNTLKKVQSQVEIYNYHLKQNPR